MRVAGVRTWLGLKVMTVLAAVHLAYMASSQINGTCTCGAERGAVPGPWPRAIDRPAHRSLPSYTHPHRPQ